MVADVATAEQAVDRAAAGDIDVVLMDLQFGGRHARLRGHRGDHRPPRRPGVLVLTTYDTDADILAAIEAGATGYLLKDAPPEELAAAVRTAAAGQSALAPTVACASWTGCAHPAPRSSRRETEVLQLVADGLSNAAISEQLFLSQATVKSHLVHIYAKLGVDSRTAAVAAAVRRGLIRRGGP